MVGPFSLFLVRNAARNPLGAAFVIDGEPITWSDLTNTVAALAHQVDTTPGAVGPIVGLMIEDPTVYILWLLATIASAKVVVPLPPGQDEEFIQGVIENCRMNTIVTDESRGSPHCHTVTPQRSLHTHAGAGNVRVRRQQRSAVMSIAYSSGTTSAPKGVIHNVGAHFASAQIQARTYNLTPGSRNLVTPPLHGARAVVQILSALYAGATSVVMSRYSTDELLATVAEQNVTIAGLVPTQYRMLIEHPSFDPRIFRSCEFMICAGSPLDDQLRNRLIELFPEALIEVYGSTEAHLISSTPRASPQAKRGSVGLTPGKVELVVLGASSHDDVGEIAVKTPAMMADYTTPDPGAQPWLETSEGRFFRTGDVGRLDSDGYLWLVGRDKDTIKVGGQTVFPLDIETVLLRDFDLVEVAVIGIPHAVLGEVPYAYVVPRTGPGIGDLGALEAPSAIAIQAAANATLRSMHMLHGVQPLHALPRTASGKVDKRELRRAFMAARRGPSCQP